ncbi:40779_t:CDS:2 [Gigaspora margarita]|uniref:40779_t:CDS:1 n=1 Tax=Gigaspora margarita TaxID=4874 RepID=A0ABN7VKY4_GIGMA|nr:40779_t:CDS:2 [Gigaspora margarita]
MVIEFVHMIDGTVGGFFRFGNSSVPVQKNLFYQILAYSGVVDPGRDPKPRVAPNLNPTDNDLKNDLWKITR